MASSHLLKTIPRISVQYVLSAIRPQTLYDHPPTDLYFATYELQKHFYGIFKHAFCLTGAFQTVWFGLPQQQIDSEKTMTVETVMETVVTVEVAAVEMKVVKDLVALEQAMMTAAVTIRTKHFCGYGTHTSLRV